MADVLGESGTSSAAPAATAPAAPAGTTTEPAAQPASATETPASEGTTGEPPKERWADILANARKKAAAEVEERFAWAKEYHPEQVRAWQRNYELPQRDPHAFRKAVNDWYEQRFGRQPAQPQGEDREPEPDAIGEDGRTRFYSADALRKRDEWLLRQFEAKFGQRLTPIERSHAQQTAKEAAQEQAKRIYADIASLPHFEELKPKIVELLKDGRTTPRSAYRKAYDEFEADRETRTRKAVVEQLRQKADSSTTNPSSPASTSTPADLRKIAQKSGWAAAARVIFKPGGAS